MRKTIVEMLKNSGSNFISGESIAGTLGISRTAVWKHIQKLRDSGYQIISRERHGYRLKDAPDLLLPSEIQIALDTQTIGRDMHYYPSVDSTNRVAKALAYHGAQDGTIVVAEEQTGGKGRLERNFFSPRGKGIWFSVVLRPNFSPHEAPKFTLMAAVAVAEAMARFNLQAQIKWPNDILFDGRKLVGILTEMSGETISRVELFRAVLEEFDKLYAIVNSSGFDKVIELWRNYNVTLGKNVRVIAAVDGGESFTGKAVDLDSSGALVVETSDGLRTVYAGDVSIR